MRSVTILRNIRDALAMAVEAIRDNKLRSALTLLGMSIGIFAIIAVATAIEVMQTSINEGLNIFGSDIIYVQRMPLIQMGDHSSRRKYWQRPRLTYRLGLELRERLGDEVEFVSFIDGTGGKTIKYKKKKTNPNVEVDGVDEWGLQALNMTLDYGRMFIHEDVEYNSKVAVLGMDVVDKLFEFEDPINKSIDIDGIDYTVVGVMARKGQMFGQSQDNYVFIPMTTFLQYYGSRWTDLGYSIKARNSKVYEDTKEKVIYQMRVIRGLMPDEENNFEVSSNDALIQTFSGFTAGIRMFAIAVSFIALLVAGIGIMNIMLVSVTERIKEIGIRKAIGASRNNILFQFLLEAIFLALIGGIIGIILGVGGGNLITLLMNANPVLPVVWVFIAFGVCSFVGIVFGIYPAYRAAGLDPIESLRHE